MYLTFKTKVSTFTFLTVKCCLENYSTSKVKVKLATIVEGDLKAPFSIATTPRLVAEDTTPFTGLVHFTLDPYFIMLSIKEAASGIIFWIFGMTQSGIEPWSPRPLANTQDFCALRLRSPKKSTPTAGVVEYTNCISAEG